MAPIGKGVSRILREVIVFLYLGLMRCIGNTVWTAHLPVQEKHRHGGARRAQKHTLTEVPEPVICEERGDKSFFSVEEKKAKLCLPTLSWEEYRG